MYNFMNSFQEAGWENRFIEVTGCPRLESFDGILVRASISQGNDPQIGALEGEPANQAVSGNVWQTYVDQGHLRVQEADLMADIPLEGEGIYTLQTFRSINYSL